MSNRYAKSAEAMARARTVLVGGVNSPVRAYAAVGGNPPFIEKAHGPYVVDVDGNEYIDYVGSYGPAILGHAHEQVTTAVSKAVRNGTSYGAPTEAEIVLAERIASALPNVERVRLTNSGTEAVMTAIRLARGTTGRSKLIKFIGCYHGHSDALLVQAGSGAATLGVPSSPGVPAAATADTLCAPYNDLSAVADLFAAHGQDIAAVLVEPVAGNMGVVPPEEGFLAGLRDLCTTHGSLLIFDEVMTGFRVAWGGAQVLYNVQPDLTTLGKVIGGGLPIGAVAGPGDIMDRLAPVGPIYQAGTLSGNPIAVAAGTATLDALRDDGVYERLEEQSIAVAGALAAAAQHADIASRVCIQRVGSMVCCFFGPGPVTNYAEAAECDTDAFAAWHAAMLAAGVHLPPSQFEALFVSLAHDDSAIQATERAARQAFSAAAEVMTSRPVSR